MSEFDRLAERVGRNAALKMLRKANPKNIEQWAYAVRHSLENQDAEIRQAREEMLRIQAEHPIMGPEDEEMFLEWETRL